MRYLVTGGAGFIGSHLIDRLLSLGHQVIALDDLSTGSLENLASASSHQAFELVQGNCTDRDLVEKVVARVDSCIHLAAAVGVRLIVEQPIKTIDSNIRGTGVLLEALSRDQKPFLLASTSEVYGKSADVPFREDADIQLGPTTSSRWSYACSKAMDEWMTMAHAQERGLPFRILRFFNTVGPKQSARYGMVLPQFIEAAIQGRDIEVYGDGKQSRCFLHVEDCVGAIIALLDDPATLGEIYNLGSQEEVSIMDLAKRVNAAAGQRSAIALRSYDSVYGAGFEDIQRRVPCIKKIQHAIGFAPKHTLNDIIIGLAATNFGVTLESKET